MPAENIVKYKISFCTTCMDRLHHLKETLPSNIRNCLPYGNVEFIVLNYNSRDELDAWMQTEMKEFIDMGILVYLKVSDIPFWNGSHAKNIAAMHASGDLLCNIDADNYINEGFAGYLNRSFHLEPDMFLTGRNRLRHGDSSGRVCSWREDYLAVRGYDESICGYGFEDVEFYSRLVCIGRKEVIMDVGWLDTIPHGDEERVKNTKVNNDVKFVLIQGTVPDHVREKMSYIIKADQTFEKIVLVLSRDMDSPNAICIDDRTRYGTWKQDDGNLLMEFDDGETGFLTACDNENVFMEDGLDYQILLDDDRTYGIFLYMLLSNEFWFKKRQENGADPSLVNEKGFGEADVCRVFNVLI